MFKFEGGDVGAADNLVVGIHVAGRAVGLGVFDLIKEPGGSAGMEGFGGNEVWYEIRTSISRKFSGGPYISSKLCWRVSGMMVCILRFCSRAEPVGMDGGMELSCDDGGCSGENYAILLS